jgi:gamma-glutamyltranspeptidase/glutathione hydrolase
MLTRRPTGHSHPDGGRSLDRREALAAASGCLLGAGRAGAAAAGADKPVAGPGRVVGWPEAAKAGEEVLAAGGNAVDAIVTAALVASVVAPQMCGPGGYGGHFVAAVEGGKKVVGIDFNTAAPAAAKPDLFPLDEKGQVKGHVNQFGWLAAGVPGILAGAQLALNRFGTRTLAAAVQPAIRYARDGFPVGQGLANSINSVRGQIARDPATAQLLLADGNPPKAGTVLKNPDLAAMLETLAKRNSVDSFYRGDIAGRIAAAFRQNGGLVTAADLAAYHAREVEPLELTWRGLSVRTPPPTAGGLTVLETLAILKTLGWEKWDRRDPRSLRAQLEALRLAWDDRLRYLGDPQKADVPIGRLLGDEHARELAGRVERALRDGKPVDARTDGRPAGGTVHLSSADARGDFAALTLTHGGSFGAAVTVPGLGLTLGHGMSRFDPRPDHPNAPGPGKRPLHNMCPTVVLRDGKSVLALGGRGGRKIPNAVLEVLALVVGHDLPPDQAVAAPRLHTEGGLEVDLEAAWSEAEVGRLKEAGYTVKRGPSATVSAVWADAGTGMIRTASR